MLHSSGARQQAAAALVFLLAAVGPSLGQSSENRTSEESAPVAHFGETVDVRVVNVEVVVTDRRGEIITGLGPEDFELQIDGEPVDIQYFSEINGGRAQNVAEESTGSAIAEVPAVGPGGRVGTSYLVFIDELFSENVDRRRVLDQLALQTAQLGPEDRMAIVAYDGSELTMLTSWTQSERDLEKALREARDRRSSGLQRAAELRQARSILPDTDGPLGSDIQTNLSLEERAYVERLEDQLERVSAAAAATLRGFANPPGRKVFVLLAGGWPWDPVEFIVNDISRPVVEAEIDRGEELYGAIVDTANLLGYTVYAVDVAGVQFTGLIGADFERTGAATDGFLRETGVHQSLQFISDETGGRALLDGRGRTAFEAVVADTRSFYWLGFTPTWQGDDSRHDVKVVMKTKGYRARARENYADFSRQTQVTTAVESALHFGTPPSEVPLLVQVGRPETKGRRKMIVPLAMAIPLDALVLLPSGTNPAKPSWTANLELRVAVLDADGATGEEIPVIPLSFEMPDRPAGGSYYRWATRLLMRRKPHDVVVAVYDLAGGALLSTALEVTPE